MNIIEIITSATPDEAEREVVEKAIVMWRERRAERLEAERQARVLKNDEDKLKSFLIEAFKQQKLEGMIIDGRSTGLSTKTQPSVADKEAFLAYIKETGQLDLLQFRLATGAVQERWNNEVEVPGVEEIELYDLFDRKS
jgi:hypothetical protein